MKNKIAEHWDEILLMFKKEYDISEAAFKTFFSALSFYSLEGNVVTLCVDDVKIGEHSMEYIKNRYGDFLQVTISEFCEEEYKVAFTLKSKIDTLGAGQPQKAGASYINSSYSFLNEKYTFDTFVIGPNNTLAQAAALSVAETPGRVYNPLFIYGGVGLGKTHLMHSIAHYILDQNPNAKIIYVTSEIFTNELILSIRKQTTNEFREKYRNIDVLLIDDIQFIVGKESTQEEFFHTFNTLYGDKKQIIISSDRPPKEIQTLEERLRSRFEWGLIVDIQSPPYETRMAILNKKNETEHLHIDDNVLSYIATNVKSNIRELEGALSKLIALSKLKKKEISLTLAEEAIKDYVNIDNHRTLTVEYIIEVVAEHFGITTEEIYSHNKSRNIAYPRQIAMFLCKKLTTLSLSDIGQTIGKRDHSTVIHGYNKIEEDIKKDDTIRNTIDVLTKKINPSI